MTKIVASNIDTVYHIDTVSAKSVSICIYVSIYHPSPSTNIIQYVTFLMRFYNSDINDSRSKSMCVMFLKIKYFHFKARLELIFRFSQPHIQQKFHRQKVTCTCNMLHTVNPFAGK